MILPDSFNVTHSGAIVSAAVRPYCPSIGWTINTACRSAVLIGTKRIVGRVTASADRRGVGRVGFCRA